MAYNDKFWQLCWSFLSNLKSKSLKIRSYWVRSIFSISFFSINCSFGHIKCTFVNSAVKFNQKPGKVPPKIRRRVWKKTLFSKKMFFMKTLLWTSNCSSENRSQTLRVESPNMVCSKFKNDTKTFFAWKTYFNSKNFFGNKKFDFEETFEKCHWGSGTIHPEVKKLLESDTFFQNKISFVLLRWRKKCTFDKAAAQFLP